MDYNENTELHLLHDDRRTNFTISYNEMIDLYVKFKLLNFTSYSVYMTLKRYINRQVDNTKRGFSFITIKGVADIWSASRTTISKAIDELEACGLIVKIENANYGNDKNKFLFIVKEPLEKEQFFETFSINPEGCSKQDTSVQNLDNPVSSKCATQCPQNDTKYINNKYININNITTNQPSVDMVGEGIDSSKISSTETSPIVPVEDINIKPIEEIALLVKKRKLKVSELSTEKQAELAVFQKREKWNSYKAKSPADYSREECKFYFFEVYKKTYGNNYAQSQKMDNIHMKTVFDKCDNNPEYVVEYINEIFRNREKFKTNTFPTITLQTLATSWVQNKVDFEMLKKRVEMFKNKDVPAENIGRINTQQQKPIDFGSMFN